MSRNHDKLDPRRWVRARRAAFNRDGWRCRACGKAGRLEAHHVGRLDRGADPYDVAGLRTLCRPCHIELHQAEADDTPGRAAWRALVAELQNGRGK